jgi:endonuclease-3
VDAPTFREVLRRLRRRYHVANWTVGRHPFEVLVAIVVSQNSTDRITELVMGRLRAHMEVTPEAIARARPSELVGILRPAGLARQKVPKVRAMARALVERYGGDMGAFLRMPTHEAREALMGLEGVGPKTADVWLSLVAGRDTMPVDTHIRRLATRWRLAEGVNYGEVSSRLAALILPGSRATDHLVLIEFGREICQARTPRCASCPVYDLCDADVKGPRRGVVP